MYPSEMDHLKQLRKFVSLVSIGVVHAVKSIKISISDLDKILCILFCLLNRELDSGRLIYFAKNDSHRIYVCTIFYGIS